MKFTTNFLAIGFFAIAGCGGTGTPAPFVSENPVSASPVVPTTAPAVAAAPASAPAAKAVVLTADEKSEIAKLADKADQDSALTQSTCPVSGENLGSMGVPIKVSAENKTAYLCCNGCKKDFDKDPKGVLAKLGK